LNSSARSEHRRYSIALELRFKAAAGDQKICGTGRTTYMNSRELVFTSDRPLEPGMQAELAVAWPFLLDGRVRLQLVLQGVITHSQYGQVEARITRYHFRTRGEWEQPEKPVLREFPEAAPRIGRPMAATAHGLHA